MKDDQRKEKETLFLKGCSINKYLAENGENLIGAHSQGQKI